MLCSFELTRLFNMMVCGALKVSFLICITSFPVSGISVDMASGVIMELGRKFSSGGVYLLVSSEQVVGRWWTDLARFLITAHTPAAIMNLEEVSIFPFPSERVPVCVMHSAGMKDVSSLQELSALGYMRLAIWLLFLEDARSVDNVLSDLQVPFNCRFLVAQSEGDTVRLTEVYRVTANHPLTLNHHGIWRKGYPMSSQVNIYERRNDLQGLVIKAVTLNSLPYSALTKEEGVYKLGGSVGPIWRMMERKLNFTSTEYRLSEDSSSGSLSADGTWSGLIGVLARREADVAVTGTTMTPMRAEVVDFTLPIFLSRYRLYIRQPEIIDVEWGSFFAPFGSGLWLGILAVIFVISALVEVCHKLLWRLGTCSAERLHRPSYQDSLFHVFAAFCAQGHDMTCRSTCIRVLFLAAHMTSVVLLAAYSAGLIASLTVERVDLPFTNFKELLSVGTHMAGVVNNSAAIALFGETKDQLLTKLYTELMVTDPENFPASTLGGMQRVCSKKFTFVAQMSRVESIRRHIPCKVVDLPATSTKVNLAIAFAKGCPYKDIINHNLQRMRGAGLLQKLQPHDGVKERHLAVVRSELNSVNLGDVTPLLVVWAASILVGASLLILESKTRRMMTRRSYVTVQPNLRVV